MMRPRGSRLVPLLILATVLVGGAAFVVRTAIQRDRDAALFGAVLQRDVAKVRYLLDTGANPNELHSILVYRDVDVSLWQRALRFVRPHRLGQDEVITVFPLDAALPAHNAIASIVIKERDARRRATLNLLLAHGANPNARGPTQNPPLYRAVLSGDDDAARRLLLCGANPNVAGVSPYNDFYVADDYKMIYGLGRAPLPQKETPLMIASEQGNTALVRDLTAHGADVNAKDEFGMTVLDRAANFGFAHARHAATVRVLLAAGAKVAANTKAGMFVAPTQAISISAWDSAANGLMDSARNRVNQEYRRDYSKTLLILEAAEARQLLGDHLMEAAEALRNQRAKK